MIRGLLVGIWFLGWALASPTASFAADLLGPKDAEAVKSAIQAVERGEWNRARALEERISDRTAVRLVRWHRISQAGTDASFAEVASFVRENPQWPNMRVLLQRAEEGMSAATPAGDVVAWFSGREPVTGDGMARLGESLLSLNRKEEAVATLRRAWVEGNFTRDQERHFYRRHRGLLTYADHLARLDRLLWEGRERPAHFMIQKVRDADRALAEARFALRFGKGNVDAAIARIPAKQLNDAGLVYERVRWRRRKDMDDGARKLLLDWMGEPRRPEIVWEERSILARRALAAGHISDAYRLVSAHGISPGGAEYAEAEWLAGWIKLRFLGDTQEALQHFQKLYDAVRFPVSRSRAAFWAGLAAEELGNKDWAYLWYRAATHHPTTYYGQLALSRLQPGQALELPRDTQPTEREAADFVNNDLARAVRMLAEMNMATRMRPFVRALADSSEDAGWKVLTARLARRLDRVDLAIDVAKRAGIDGRGYVGESYPAPTLPRLEAKLKRQPRVEEPLVLAVIRQESLFDTNAMSPVGARGLMQLMPKTANKVAKDLGLPYSSKNLTANPAYNVTLGRAYLEEMISSFNGSYVLAIAAYNAGPGRARAWIKAYGDPRDAEVEVIDWIEMIPFAETRNYVQRVLENLQVYRSRLLGPEVALAPEEVLRRKE